MSTQQSITRQHAEWLSLIDVSGPFLSLPVLQDAFSSGLDLKENEVEMRRRLRLAYEEWADNQEGARAEPAIHHQWLRFVLEEILDMKPEAIREGQQIPATISIEDKKYSETIRPTLVIHEPDELKSRLLVQLYPKGQNLTKAVSDKPGSDSPDVCMMALLRKSDIRLGLVTNGEQWMLVDAPANETTGYYSWYSSLWLEEPITLRAFYSLLGMQRFFGLKDDQTIEALLTQSANKQQEVTTQLGDQVRRAVEVLVQTLDRIDKDSQRTLLKEIKTEELYEAALTMMMRLVFLLSAEERKLLLLDDPIYDNNYAVSTLQKQLQEQADQHGEEVLGLRSDAWSRLLATFRAVYGGIDNPDLLLPAYGGHLFDPDRFPFLEGRALGTSWHDVPANPLNVDNRTVLYLLNALQYLQIRIGGTVEARRLSFRGLDIEQIGHVYEGLLDHTIKRAETAILGLQGSGDTEPEVALDELELRREKGAQTLLDYLHEITGRSVITLQKSLTTQREKLLENPKERSRLMEACDNQQEIFQRVLPFAGLIRRDTFNNFMIVTPGSVYMTKGSDRRSTGTHYTPRSLTEPIVKHALDPLVYLGPAEGWPEEQWQLRSAADILSLTVCDFAMGSGAFLVQTCRYLSEKLVEAWEQAEITLDTNGASSKPQITPEGQLSHGEPAEELVPDDKEGRLMVARRLVSERCIYGVDKNPMAVEMAKLSLWLITLAKGRPFTFLDHSLRSGDSLLGVSDRQLANWSLNAKTDKQGENPWAMRDQIRRLLNTAITLRKQIINAPNIDIHDTEKKSHYLKKAENITSILNLGADLLIALTLNKLNRQPIRLLSDLAYDYSVLAKAYEEQNEIGRSTKRDRFVKMRQEVDKLLTYDQQHRHPFHWHLEFPEVFVGKEDDAGFAAIIGNPPFQGGGKITGSLGTDYRDYLVEYLSNGQRGIVDLCAYFFLRATKITRNEAMSALIATNTIAQGDTRKVGLDQIMNSGWAIPRAIPDRKWPGDASLEIAQVWLKNGNWKGQYILNDKVVDSIASALTISGNSNSQPYPLYANANKSFIGSYVLGMGFILEPEEAIIRINQDLRNKEVIYPYLNGEDLNSRPDQSPSRWVINFHDWPLAKAKKYAECFDIIETQVKPERLKNNRLVYRDKWWHYAEKRPALYSTIANMKRVLVRAQVSRTHALVFFEPNIVFSNMTVILALEKDSEYAIVQSSVHEIWVNQYSSSLKTDQRYTPSDCFETFPFPSTLEKLDSIGESYYNHRQSIMLNRQEGLTKTYNRFHNLDEISPDIIKLRELHKKMDEAVAHAYGWDDLKLNHGFYMVKRNLRYTISEVVRQEVLNRLLQLNHQQHEKEEKAGLVDTNGKVIKTKKLFIKDSFSKNGKKTATNINASGIEAQETLF